MCVNELAQLLKHKTCRRNSSSAELHAATILLNHNTELIAMLGCKTQLQIHLCMKQNEKIYSKIK